MKVFLSHQRADSAKAIQIADRLKNRHSIDSYLDVIDPYLGRGGEALATHIRTQMASCTQLLAVVSFATRDSQWVPWEIGVATEKNFPLATYADYSSAVPEFLRSWPYLRTIEDVDKYAAASRVGAQQVQLRKAVTASTAEAIRSGTQSFFSDLRARLNQ